MAAAQFGKVASAAAAAAAASRQHKELFSPAAGIECASRAAAADQQQADSATKVDFDRKRFVRGKMGTGIIKWLSFVRTHWLTQYSFYQVTAFLTYPAKYAGTGARESTMGSIPATVCTDVN